nr:copia protein [Tanacetum cinerariifolium]
MPGELWIEAIRLFLAFALYMGFMVYQMDVKSAFLYEEIEEEVYVTQPKGFEDPHNPKHVYRVVKALYGLHQAPRAWYIILVQIYVDNIIFGSTNKAWCDEFEVLMKGEFEMSAMGELTFFLGLQVKQLPDGIFISQDKYVNDMLKKFDIESLRTATTPYEVPKHKSKGDHDDAVNVHLFRSMIGSLMYLTASRPDIMFSVSACSRHQVTPMTSHLNAVKKIFKYLKGQPNLGLWYPRDSPFWLEAYSDSDYAGSHGDRKSTTGGCQFLGRRLISWQCKKQTVVATSFTEAEYVTAASCCGQSTICIVKNPVFHQRTKHIKIRQHFIRDANEKNLIQVLKIHTDENVADLLTKAFDGPQFHYLIVHIGMLNPYVLGLEEGISLRGGLLLLLLYSVSSVSRFPMLRVIQVLLLVVLVRADDLVPAGSYIIPTGSYSFMLWTWFLLLLVYADDFVPAGRCTITTGSSSFILLDWFLLFWATTTVHNHEAGPSQIIANIDGNKVVVTESLIRTQLQLNDVDGLHEFTLIDVLDGMRVIGFILDGMIGNIRSKRHKILMYPRFLQMILGIQTTDPSPRPTFDFTAKLFSNMKLNWDGPHMPLLASMLVVPTGEDGANAVATGADVVHDVLTPIVPPTHSSSSIPGPSSAPQPSPMREPTPVWEPTPVSDPTPVRESTPRPVQDPTPDSPRPPSPPHYPRSEEVGATTSTKPPSPTRQTSFQADVSEGGGDFVSSPQSNEAPPTPAATAAGGAEDSAALTALSLKFDRCLNRVTSLENELGITKKVLGGVVLKLVTRQDIDLEALHTLASTSLGGDSSDKAVGHDAAEVPADTTMPFRSTSNTQRHLRKPFTYFASAHDPENIPAGAGIPAAATTIPAGSSMDAAIHAGVARSSFIPAVDKGKAPMVDNSLPADLLSEQERILKNLHDYQLGEDLAKKLHAEQEAEFARQQEELAQKAHAERIASPTEHGPGLSDQHRRELDVAQLIYTEADWVELLAKIATNSALSKQLLGDDVTKDNMNERLGMLLLRKRRELAEQSRVKPMTKTQQRDYIRDFIKNNSASVYNQGWTMKKVKALSIA